MGMSDRFYKAKGKEDNEAMRGYQKLSALEHREISHAAKFKDMISPKKYHEEWDEIRHLVYYPVHITPGYEGQVKAANYASSNQYKKKHLAEAYKNAFKAHETEGYKQQLMLHDKLSRINYTKAWNEALQNSPYITETPERALNRYRGQLASNNLYKASAKKIMEHYNLITDEPRMKQAFHAAKLVSDKLYKEKYSQDQKGYGSDLFDSILINHVLKAGKVTKQSYEKDAKERMGKASIPNDALYIQHPKTVGKLVSNKAYVEDAKNVKSKFGTLLINDCYALKRLNDIKNLQSEKHYKDDFCWLQGNVIPIQDLPENARVKNAQQQLSQSAYKKDLKEFIQGHGINSEKALEVIHALGMTDKQSMMKYKQWYEANKHNWSSGESINTPFTQKAISNKDLISVNKYVEKYMESRGKTAVNVITPIMDQAKIAGQNASESGYKSKFTADNKKLPFHSKMDYNKAAELSKANNLKISDSLYKKKYTSENVGTPHDMRDSVQMTGEQKAQIMLSDLGYHAAAKEN